MQKISCWLCDFCRKVIGYGIGPEGEHKCEECSTTGV